MSATPAPILIGYFPKRRTQRPGWLEADAVREICSVSECMAAGPEGWIHAWKHNAWGVFDTPALAWGVVPEREREAFDLFAYAVYPARFVSGFKAALDVQIEGVAPRDPSFLMLGYDIVSRGPNAFECSPLSCNGWAGEVGTNEWCLVDDLDEALRLASIAEASGCEPGDYLVVQVWRGSAP